MSSRMAPAQETPGSAHGLGGLWLVPVPVACCDGPHLVAGLAAASALAWGALGLALAALLVGALTVNRPRCRAPRRARRRR